DFREDEVKITDALVKRALEEIRNALGAAELRVLINKDTRKLLRPLLEPLELAHVGDQWLLVERTWMDHFERCESQHPGAVSVRNLRQWIDQPRAKGLAVALQNLIINTYLCAPVQPVARVAGHGTGTRHWVVARRNARRKAGVANPGYVVQGCGPCRKSVWRDWAAACQRPKYGAIGAGSPQGSV